MWVRCTDDNIAVHTNFNSTDVYVDVEQFAKALIERREDELKIGGDTLESTERIQLTSMQLAMVLESGRINGMHASANKSQIVMQTNATKMTSTASHHTVSITGGTASLQIFTGNVSITITTNIGETVLPTSLSLLTPPTDNFASVGPAPIDSELHGSRATDVEEIDDILTHTTPSVSIRSEFLGTGGTTSSSAETTRSAASATELSSRWILPNEQPISSVGITANSQIDTVGNTKGSIGLAHGTDNVYGTSNETPFPERNIIPGGAENSIGFTTTLIVPSNGTAVFSEATNGVSDRKMAYSTLENVFTEINTVDTSRESGNSEEGAEQAGNQSAMIAVFTSSAFALTEQLPSQAPVIGEASEVNTTSVSQNFENSDDTSLTSVKELSVDAEGVLLHSETIRKTSTSQTGIIGNEHEQTAATTGDRQYSSMNEHREIQEGEDVLTNPSNVSEDSNTDEYDTKSSLGVVTTAANEVTRDSVLPSALQPLKVAEPCMISSAFTLNSGEK
uniref:Uncharacterized protein n=1 Tax=Parascaris univalens TaxID=6257 RepID=A0A915BBC1_PARUN